MSSYTKIVAARIAIMLAAIACLSALGAPETLGAHPLHTTITELTEDRAHGTVRAVIRVFADDFGTVIARRVHGAGGGRGALTPDAAAFAYASTSFAFTDRSSHLISSRPCGMRRTGALVWVCLEATVPQGLAAVAVRNAVLCDLYDDQVNVVQGTVGGVRHSILFTRGDRAKPIG